MSFFTLVRREMYGSLNRLIVISALGGISTAAILTAINSGAQAADSGKVSLWSAALFIVALFLFIKTQHYILITATAEIEAIMRTHSGREKETRVREGRRPSPGRFTRRSRFESDISGPRVRQR